MKFSKKMFAFVFMMTFIIMASAFEGEEEPCPAFEGDTEFPSCEACVSNSCGFVVDEGDCVKDCSTVEDSECYSLETNSGMDASVICETAVTDGNAAEEVMCAAFEASGEIPTCETCVSAGCGWTEDDGDCLESCASVNDGAACIDLAAGQAAADVCGAGSTSEAARMLSASLGFVFMAIA